MADESLMPITEEALEANFMYVWTTLWLAEKGKVLGLPLI